jgi:hypothetical protein
MRGIAITLLVVGCVDQGPSPTEVPPGPISYREHVQPIWDKWCLRCHYTRTPRLPAGASAGALAGLSVLRCDTGGTEPARFVVPGDPARSYLLYRLTLDNRNDYDAAACGRAMPADSGGPLVKLDPGAVEIITTWIEEGAVFD